MSLGHNTGIDPMSAEDLYKTAIDFGRMCWCLDVDVMDDDIMKNIIDPLLARMGSDEHAQTIRNRIRYGYMLEANVQ